MPLEEPGSTAIVVLTPEAEPVAGHIYRAHTDAGRDGMTPHVTLVVPFIPAACLGEDVLDRLRRLFEGFAVFDYHLRRFERFDGGVLYLAPEPPGPFVSLVSALAEDFPEYPPYEGIHEVVIPHVTVAERDDPELMGRIRAEVKPRLPIHCRARAVTLVERGPDLRWRSRTSIPLGSLK